MDRNVGQALPGMGFIQPDQQQQQPPPRQNGTVDGADKRDEALNDVSEFLASFSKSTSTENQNFSHEPLTTPYSHLPAPPKQTIPATDKKPTSETSSLGPTTTAMKDAGLTEEGGLNIPDCIVFSSDSTGAYHVLPGQSIEKLPQQVVKKLLQLEELQGKGHPALYLGTIQHSRFENLVRLQQFADHQDYEPISMPRAAQLRWLSRGLGSIEFVDPKTKEVKLWQDNPTHSLYAAPESTRKLFATELETYLFSLEVGYPALQKRSRDRIFRCYPKTASAVFALVETVFPRAAQAKDTEIMDRVREYINSNGKTLTSSKSYVGIMKRHMKENSPLGQVLWETYISASEALRREVDKPSGTAERKEKPAPTTPTAPAVKQREHMEAGNGVVEADALPAKLRWLVEAVFDGALIRASQDGFGTLRRDDYPEKRFARNQDFKFIQNELLVIDRSKQSTVSSTYNNVVVVNARGETGDIFRSLTRTITFADLGVSAEANRLGYNDDALPQSSHFPLGPDKKRKWGAEHQGEYDPPPRW